jgi:antibiotic biosynthesis monooxygenase (ABM) superfamily enzyme
MDEAVRPGNRAATVVISREVRPGREAEFARWARRIQRAVRRARGFEDCVVQAPDPSGNRWVITYRFSDAASLDRWLASPRRRALIERSGAYLASKPVEHRLADPVRGDVTLVSAARVRYGAEAAYAALHEQAVAAARALGGLVRVELLPPVPGVQDETVSVLSFADRAALDRWLGSQERRDVLARMAELAESDRKLNVVDGFAGWFAGRGPSAPRRWKQALVVFAGLIPVSTLVTVTREALWPDLPMSAVILVSAVGNVGLLTWVVMPALVKYLRPWLVR